MKNTLIFLSLIVLMSGGGCTGDETRSAGSSGDPAVMIGARILAGNGFAELHGRRVGLITNHTSMVGEHHLADLMHQSPEVELVALFAPEHGIRGTADAGAEITTETDSGTGLTVHSLHGETYKPTPEMLDGIDILVFDMQDVGTRFYTYINTMGLAMQAAASAGIGFMVLDRPNPIGGRVEGFTLEPGHTSFIGMYEIPATHGMTIGEIALMLKDVPLLDGLEGLDLTVIAMKGWSREMLWPDTGLEWIPPSPNIPDFETAVIYPGACFFGSVSGNEGRGTMEPFRLVGTLWGDPVSLAADLNDRELPGLRFEPVTYSPQSIPGMSTTPRLLGQTVHGVRQVVTDPYGVRSVEAGVHLMHAFYHQAPDSLKSEFFVVAPMLRISGTPKLYRMIEDGYSPSEITESWSEDVVRFMEMRKPYLLYQEKAVE
jgi:uncharacterized protein YbbC (DUF1343 family)